MVTVCCDRRTYWQCKILKPIKCIIKSILCSVDRASWHAPCKQPTWRTFFSCMFISVIYMFRAALCPSSGELLYQSDTWLMSHCVDDRLVCRSICSYIMSHCVDDRLVCRTICSYIMSHCIDDRLVCRSICSYIMSHCIDDHLICRSICSYIMSHCVDDRLVCRSICSCIMSHCIDCRLVCKSICSCVMSYCVDDIKQVSRWYNNSPDDGHMAARNM